MRHLWLIAMVLLTGSLGACHAPIYSHIDYGFDAEKGYLLDTGDNVRVLTYDLEGVSNTYLVDPDGNVSIPLAGSIAARGRSVKQLEAAIVGSLAKNVVQKPYVAVQLAAARPFYILGEIKTAGQFAYIPDMTAEAAIAVAGGYSDRAERSQVRVSRQGANGTDVLYVPTGFKIRPGDTVYVPERWF